MTLSIEGRQTIKAYDTVKKQFEVENIRYTEPAVQGELNLITVTFRVRNPKQKHLNSVYVDIEFFDSNDEFLFGGEYGGRYHELSPNEEDNMSIEVQIPSTIEYVKIKNAKVFVYELGTR